MTMLDSLLRLFFERAILSRWKGKGLRIVYWDNREAKAGFPPHNITLTFHHPSALRELILFRTLGFGNSYARGNITIEGNFRQFLADAFHTGETVQSGFLSILGELMVAIRGRGKASHAEENARFHYDRGNQFFSKWLDGSMTYSCAYFRTEQDDLATAQWQKNELLCRKLELKPGQSLLDVGCGWGAFMFHAVEHYGITAVGVTPSREQAEFIRKKAIERDCTSRISVMVADWRTVHGQFDRVVSVGMFEHVGSMHGRRFFERWQRWLADDGVSVLHTIGAMQSKPPDPWIDQSIFPGGYLPSLAELAGHARETGMIIMDVENMWRHYALTLSAWVTNYERNRVDIVREFGERFDRTWWLYLNSSRAAFEAGRLCLWQTVLTKGKRATQPLTREQWSLAFAQQPTSAGPPKRNIPIHIPTR